MKLLATLASILAVLIHVGFSSIASAASFDCEKAGAIIEKLICSDSQLSELDSRLDETYAAARTQAPNSDHIRFEQRDWIKNVRNKCTDIDCYRNAYMARISALESPAQPTPAHSIFETQTTTAPVTDVIKLDTPIVQNVAAADPQAAKIAANVAEQPPRAVTLLSPAENPAAKVSQAGWGGAFWFLALAVLFGMAKFIDSKKRKLVTSNKEANPTSGVDQISLATQIDIGGARFIPPGLSGGEELLAEDDPLYDQAVEIVIKNRSASIAKIQLQLRIGYNRAIRLIERMEAEGILAAAQLTMPILDTPLESELRITDAIVEWLKEKGWEERPEVDEENQSSSTRFLYNINDDLSVTCFLDAAEKAGFIKLTMYFLDPKIPKAKLDEAIKYTNEVNVRNVVGQLAVMEDKTLRWYSGIDVEGTAIETRLIENLLDAGLTTMKRRLPQFMTVCFAGKTAEEALEIEAE